ncbi:polysaccharide biosynthesis protein [Rhodoplanes elegans]|uniref:Polysaccharide biosynthesis protein n=1 Tax=Rhodoplanes elegans TaxID=29408 RepID=A0A327KKG1_9BRAD|nr:polysaccharide biosynthesis/export family protein [Rhodoplanes elegans]MBK5961162.1 polysaccharide biosynthesis protein [Rhodoplanes elegans]RAI38023.1 polysaccharide biosynthesis protein [Rhodoplanes elegans]
MRHVRNLVVILAALAVSGCVSTPRFLMPGPPPPPPSIEAVVYGGPDATGAIPGPSPAVAAALVRADDPDPPYTLDAGDRLRVVVYGQEGLTNTYAVDAAGRITLPLIGGVAARGRTTAELARVIAARLRDGYIREPHVAVEVESYRPFFILGEVAFPGQYPFVAHLTAETAVAIAGGFTPRAYRTEIEITRPTPQGPVRLKGPPLTPVRPGDTVVVSERWF